MQVVTKTVFGNIPKKSVEQYKAEVQIEINEHKVDLNKMVFHKTRDEKSQLKKAKKLYNKDRNRYFAVEQRQSLIAQIVNHKIPRWGATAKFTFA